MDQSRNLIDQPFDLFMQISPIPLANFGGNSTQSQKVVVDERELPTLDLSDVMPDLQGSTRAVMNSTGAVLSRHDYLPFGEEVDAGVGMRVGNQGYNVADGVRQKYAGMETDDASGMAHTLWRQYESRSARWTGPDPYGGSMTVADPQSFNRYTYVNNDPVNQVDPTGLKLSDIGVYQTDNPQDARIAEQQSLHDLQTSVNTDYQKRQDEREVETLLASFSEGDEEADVTATAEVDSPTGESQNPESQDSVTCNIEVRLSEINATKKMPFTGLHAYIVTDQSDEDFKIYHRAGPSTDGRTIFANSGKYVSGSVDYESGTPPNASIRMKGSCAEYRKSFNDTESRTNNSKIPYKTFPNTLYRYSTNSNAYSYTALKRAGLPVKDVTKVLDSQRGFNTVFPGWGTTLTLK